VPPYIILAEYFITHIIGIRTLASMCKQMFLQIRLPTECFFTHTTRIRMLATMCKMVCLQIRLLTECFITHSTGIRTLATMCKPVCLQIRLVTECFITHITGIRTLATMCKLVCLHNFTVANKDLTKYFQKRVRDICNECPETIHKVKKGKYTNLNPADPTVRGLSKINQENFPI
jgi:hypothetical protein